MRSLPDACRRKDCCRLGMRTGTSEDRLALVVLLRPRFLRDEARAIDGVTNGVACSSTVSSSTTASPTSRPHRLEDRVVKELPAKEPYKSVQLVKVLRLSLLLWLSGDAVSFRLCRPSSSPPLKKVSPSSKATESSSKSKFFSSSIGGQQLVDTEAAGITEAAGGTMVPNLFD